MSAVEQLESEAPNPVSNTSSAHDALRIRGDLALTILSDIEQQLGNFHRHVKSALADIKRADLSLGIKEPATDAIARILKSLRDSDPALATLTDEQLYEVLKERQKNGNVFQTGTKK